MDTQLCARVPHTLTNSKDLGIKGPTLKARGMPICG